MPSASPPAWKAANQLGCGGSACSQARLVSRKSQKKKKKATLRATRQTGGPSSRNESQASPSSAASEKRILSWRRIRYAVLLLASARGHPRAPWRLVISYVTAPGAHARGAGGAVTTLVPLPVKTTNRGPSR
jgi:hypothetical protein